MASRAQSTFGSASRIAEAKQAEYIGFLHRHPFATDAYEHGFITGIREDYNLQIEDLRNVRTPVGMLDNDFHDPDLERYVERFEQYEPEVAALGDAETTDDAGRFLEAIDNLRVDYPDTTYIVVPKSQGALEKLADADITLGYAMGYSDIQAGDFSDIADWRGLDIHLLGASPPKQYDLIDQLTQPTMLGDPPANIVGADWNGPHRMAYHGEYWSRDGWKPADMLTIRKTVRESLKEIRAFWQERGVWPGSTPKEEFGAAIKKPDDPLFVRNGEDVRTQDELEDAIVVEYEDGHTFAYQSEHDRDFIEYREGRLEQVVDVSTEPI